MMPRKYIDVLVVIIASIVALYVGSHLVVLSMGELALVTTIILLMLWTLTAGIYWWTPLLVGATLTGVFYIGFKIYPIEVSILISLLGLAPLLLVQNEKLQQTHRRPLPFIFYLAAIYLTLRMSVDIIPAAGARGNLGRIYFEAIWPFVFGWLFHLFGKTSVAWTSLVAVFVCLLVRAGGAIIGYFMSTPLYIPGINYVISITGEESLIPMRTVAFNLLLVSLILYHASRSMIGKLLLLPVLVFSSGLMLAGQGRFATLMFLLLPVCFFAWRRSWLIFFTSGLVAAGLIIFINTSPQVVDQMPPYMARSLTGFILKPNVSSVEEGTVSSDEWHSGLRDEGLHRWTESPFTFLFGYGIRPSPLLYETKEFQLDAKTAINTSANVAAYESGLWTVLAVVGAVGFLFYFFLFFHFWRLTLPYFLRPPSGQMWEGFLFWGCYSSLAWFATCHFQGGFPSLELFLIILATDLLDDRREAERRVEREKIPLRQEALA
jgi:hypothetical protein